MAPLDSSLVSFIDLFWDLSKKLIRDFMKKFVRDIGKVNLFRGTAKENIFFLNFRENFEEGYLTCGGRISYIKKIFHYLQNLGPSFLLFLFNLYLMKRLLSVFFFFCLLILIPYGLFGGYEEQLKVLLESRQHRNIYWVVSFAVLSSDIFIPVPSSLVMIMNGKVLGFFAGTVLSTVSGLVSSAIGFYLGRKSESFVDRFFSKEQKNASSKLFLKYGMLAVMFSKALPLISEAVSFLSGTTPISFKDFWLFL